MSEFYQVKTIKDRSGQEIIDLQQVNFIFRRIFELLQKTEAPKLTGDLDLGGNRALNGPASQTTAQNSELITKGYLSCVESARLISAALQSVGSIKPAKVTVPVLATGVGNSADDIIQVLQNLGLVKQA